MRKIVKVRAMAATITQFAKGSQSGSWKVTYRDDSGRVVSGGVLKTEAKAKARAVEILTRMQDDGIDDLSPEEARLIRRLRDAGIAPADLDAALGEMCGTQRATVGEAVGIFLAREVESQHYSYQQRKDYERILGELLAAFGAEVISAVRPAALEMWADGWKIGAKRWNNKRTILATFFRWAVGRNYITKSPAEALARKRLPRRGDHEVMTPRQFSKALTACADSHIPWLALSGFAGLRGVEIYGRPDDRGSGLKWEDIDWKRKIIMLSRSSAKQTRNTKTRHIPMCAALEDWLSPWMNAKGPVYPVNMTFPNCSRNSVTSRLAAAIGRPWPANALRASRASYRLAETGCVATVTLEMGHSKDMLIGTYLNPRFGDDAKVWFSLNRETAKRLANEPEIIEIRSVG